MNTIETQSQVLNIDAQVLRSYMRLTIHEKLKKDKEYENLTPLQVRTHIHKVGEEIFLLLKKGETLYNVYNNMSDKNLKKIYDVRLDKDDINILKSIVNKIKKIPIGPVGKNSTSHAVHNILIKI